MEGLIKTVGDFLSDPGYMPHGMCLLWDPAVFWMHAVSDGLIALSYFSIPLAMGRFALQRRDLQYPWLLALFIAFVAACGVTHLFGVWTLWVPSYGYEAVAKLVTAVVSALTAIVLWPLIPHAVAMPSRKDLEERNAALNAEIARRHAAERQLRELNRDLEAIVRARTEALEQANARLNAAIAEAEAANRAKSELIAVVSHEVRTPLNAILGLNRLLAQSAVLGERERRQVATIESAGEILLAIVNDVLDFSKIEAGKLELATADFDLQRCVRDVVGLFEPQAMAKGLALHLEIAPETPRAVTGDAVRLRQILYNLLSNAVKFTTAGRVAVRVDAAAAPEAEGGGRILLRCEVTDTGCGIADDRRAQLFEKFVQADVTVAARFGGTGLGLAICKRLVDLMGGRIGCDSAVGRGSRFRFELPCAVASLPRGGETVLADVPALPPLKLLVAEDVALNQVLLRELLLPLGHQLVFVETGRQVVERASLEAFDAILMDVAMPEMDGIEATRRLRALDDPERRDVPIIGLTASVLESQVRACRRAGMDACLAKPLDLRRFLAVLARHARRPEPRAVDGAAEAEAVPGDVVLDRRKLTELTATLSRRTVEDLYRELLERSRDMIAGIAAARESPQRLAHSLAGMAGNFGAVKLARIADTIQHAAPGTVDVDRAVDTLEQALAETESAVLANLAANPERPSPGPAVAPWP